MKIIGPGDEMNMGDHEGVKNDAKVSPGLGMWVHSGHIH